MRKPKIALIAAENASGEIGGVERLYLGMRDAINARGAACEILNVLSNESNIDEIKRSYLRFYDLDLSAYDCVISTKAPSYAARHRIHICYLVHTMRVFYDMFEQEFRRPSKQLLAHRSLIHQLDTAALSDQRIRHRFAVGEQVRLRLLDFNGLNSEVLRHPTTLSNFKRGKFEYILLPGRLHRWKRVDLVINAMRYVRTDIKLVISGTGEQELALRQAARGDDRIIFAGRVSDDRLIELYADALAVAFVPVREDLGLVTLEAFRSSKPVITCRDSGEPARLVRDAESGFVCAPDPQEIAARINELRDDPNRARRMGEAGAAFATTIRWDAVAERLLGAMELDQGS
jgi:glycosyltransferase involved in cell wall biosynthesis